MWMLFSKQWTSYPHIVHISLNSFFSLFHLVRTSINFPVIKFQSLFLNTGHLSPSIYSKKRINIRSFSILIMSAAFIVLLAVLSIAGLAFYFSNLKPDSNECEFYLSVLLWLFFIRPTYNLIHYFSDSGFWLHFPDNERGRLFIRFDIFFAFLP